jgi:Zn-dependent protease
MNIEMSLVQYISIIILPLLLAITLHEAAHGWTALQYGDSTAYLLGRVTLNPLKHIDPIGTVILPLSLMLIFMFSGVQGFLFGWAKPIPVNTTYLRNPRRDMAIVAAAGPIANLIMMLGWLLIAKIGQLLLEEDYLAVGEFLNLTGIFGVTINLILMAVNLLPILPLDGGRILQALLPIKLAEKYASFEVYGFIIVLILLASGGLGYVLSPVFLFQDFLFQLVGI